ncbi:MAG: AAA family ATPase [Gammaproteobacteria bacterium]|nr:AAA family ATPase [Gammaproteobacteria bacterium]
MSDGRQPSPLELEVKDFGPIAEGKIELRPLTVFVGPSNTGKSYLAILIYALHRHFSRSAWPPRYPRAYLPRQMGTSERLRRETVDALRGMAEMLARQRDTSAGGRIVLPGAMRDALVSELRRERRAVEREVQRCFGVDRRGSLVRKGRAERAQVTLRRQFPNDLSQFEYALTLGRAVSEISMTPPGQLEVPIDSEDGILTIGRLREIAQGPVEEGNIGDERRYWARRLIAELTTRVLSRLFDPLDRQAFYLPADRTGVMHAHSVVVSALVEGAAMAGLRPPARTAMLSGVMADFLEQLIELDRSPGRGRGELGARIEDSILGGAVRVDRSPTTGYPSFAYRPNGWKNDLPLMNASSMVSELAPVVLYLRHMVRQGDLLIVEEPESHLHPAMQVQFTRQLAAVVLSGVRVIVTTHSEWLLDELANIVQRSELPEARSGEPQIDRPALSPDQVGAWLFQPKSRPKGSRVSEIRLDESGVYPSGFDDVAVALHNDWAGISSRIADRA